MSNLDESIRTLHLGCGRHKEPDSYGVDLAEESAADLIWDLDRRPWPLPDARFDRVVMTDVLEHVGDVIGVMEESYRVTAPGARIHIQAPFAASHYIWTDPTHRRGFTSRSFKYFSESFSQAHFQYTKARFEVISCEYVIVNPKWFDRLLLRLANRSKFRYERRFMYWYPAENIRFELERR